MEPLEPEDRPTAAPSNVAGGSALPDAETARVERMAAGLRGAGASAVGEKIGRYRIIEAIAEGGMGTVYKAEQQSPVRRIVALKLIKLGMDTAQVIARFESERQALAMMEHPSIAKVFDAGATENGRPYFVMEYVPGEAITTYCDKHQLTTRERLELFSQVCDAVQHAHQKGVIHRDLKPTNILVSVRDGKAIPKVIDFGIAKATNQKLTDRTLFTETGQLVGTPEYMSPEQAEMSGLDVDTRSDVYSLGVVLYELLTGTLPFEAKSLRSAGDAEIRRIIREVDPPRPSTRLSSLDDAAARQIAGRRQVAVDTLARDLRGELEWIPLKAMHKDRTRRYRTATELADDIGNYLANRPLVAAPDSAGYRLRKLLRRNKGPVIAAAVVVVVLLAGITGTTIGLVGQARQRAEAQRQAAEARTQAEIAQAVSAFQQDMLASADPDNLLGDKVTVMQAIEAAQKELDAGKLKNQPLVEAAVRTTIGRTLRGLGRFEAAEPNMRRALTLRQAALSADDPDIADSMGELGWVLQNEGKLTEAEPLERDALEMYRRTLPAESKTVGGATSDLGLLLQDEGKLADAEPLFRQALAIDRKVLAPDDGQLATGLNNLAGLLVAQGKLDEAEPLYREALDIRRKDSPAGHPDIAQGLNNLASLLQSQGKLADAEQDYREALAIYRKALPAGHPDIGAALTNLAYVLQAQDKLSEAEPLYREAVELFQKALPAGHPDIALSMDSLAYLLRLEGKLAEAETLCRQSLEMYRKALEPGSPDIAITMGDLASILRAEGKLSEAESLSRDSLVMRRKAFDAGHPRIAQGMENLALILEAEGKTAEAEPMLREALAMRRKALPAGHPDIAESLDDLGNLLKREGKLAEAEALLREARDLRSKRNGARAPATTRSAEALTDVLDAMGKRDEAEGVRMESGLAGGGGK